ncbi:MAG: hypothetical protein NTW27_10925 [Deltaproteobacteria bacterium]|nr:hypothetical protein [Deltaproteobacteria bacterium]
MMRDMSSSAWLRRGSSIVFDRFTLGPLIVGGTLVSMREALRWMNAWPAEPPGNCQTVLVCGIETFLDVMEPAEAQNFLKSRVNPFVQEFQARWDQRGLVFGFGTHERSFELTASDEEVLFIRRDHQRVRLSYSLWDGSATMNVTRLIRDEQGKSITVGYYVLRIS